MKKMIFSILLWGVCLPGARAAEIHFANGDRISGDLISATSDSIIFDSKMLGEIDIKRKNIREISGARIEPFLTQEEKKDKKIEWKSEVSAGYNRSSGNTQTEEGAGEIFINRRRSKVDEYTLRAKAFISTRDKEMNARRYLAFLRYAYSFGRGKQWYNFYSLEGAHDRFANIDGRVTPTVGIGYWFSDHEPLKVMMETGAGLEYTDFRGTTQDRTELILTPRAMVEWTLSQYAVLREDVTLIPSLTEGGGRIHSETSLTGSITDTVKLRLSMIDDYNSNAAAGAKKNDIRLISSIVYAFEN
ncbi:MAG: DUF481 domain-containing protein [Candidatus Omnitrophica bacterium]|nr:DUF481 domain-containing protein [Candidatus Omnitrophota bacterium]